MTVSQNQVAHTAKLAKLRLQSHELEEYTSQLNDVLDYMKILEQVNTDDVEATNQVTGLKNVMRKDKAEDYPADKRAKLLREVPLLKEGYVVVPNTIS